MRSIVAIFYMVLISCAGAAVAQDMTEESWLTRSAYYRVSYTPRLEPLTINRIHSWVFHIENAEGTPIDGAKISVTGGMPEHNHGLPTDPRMTEALGDGDYVLEGFRFHMSGYWELTVTVEAEGRRDTVVISLTI